MTKKEQYHKHLNAIVSQPLIGLNEEQIDFLIQEMISLLPSSGKLYKYRNFIDENNHFENTMKALKNGYIWLASSNSMNDKIDTTLNLSYEYEAKCIKKTLLENKDAFLKRILKDLFNKYGLPYSLSDEEFNEFISCYTKEGRVIKSKVKQILAKAGYKSSQIEKNINILAQMIEMNSVKYPEKIEEISKKFINTNKDIQHLVKIYCMSERYDTESMWAYYGNDNKGFCIEYDFNKVLNLSLDNKRILLNLFKIEYSSKKEKFSFSKILKAIILEEPIEEKNRINMAVMKQLLTKNRDWDHEREWRIVVSTEANEFKVDLVSAIIVDRDMVETEKGKRLINLAREKGWKIYIRKLSELGTTFEYNLL